MCAQVCWSGGDYIVEECPCRYGWHSLTAAYGINPENVVFIPHGVSIPKGSTHQRHLAATDMASMNGGYLRSLLADSGAHSAWHRLEGPG